MDEVTPPLAYSITSFCDATGLGRSFIFDAIRTGELKASKAGRRTIITHPHAVEYLATLPAAGGEAIKRPMPDPDAAYAIPRIVRRRDTLRAAR